MTASIEDLLREQAEKKRLEEELRIAHEIQMSLLPQGPLGMPGLSVTALCVPAREVGGDYYDFLPLDDHRVGVLIADVSGKGTSAALYMAEMKGLMLSLSRIHTSPRDLLIDANRIIAEHLDARSFITMTYAVLDLQRADDDLCARRSHAADLSARPTGRHASCTSWRRTAWCVGLKIDNGETFDRLLREETMPIHSRGSAAAVHRRHHRSDGCQRRLLRRGPPRPDLLEQHADLPTRNCASGCCARLPRSSATRRSTTT